MTLPISQENEIRCHTHLFTVRVWMQKRPDGEKEWHGKVQHVTGGEARYFRDWPTLVAYLQQTLGDLSATET